MSFQSNLTRNKSVPFFAVGFEGLSGELGFFLTTGGETGSPDFGLYESEGEEVAGLRADTGVNLGILIGGTESIEGVSEVYTVDIGSISYCRMYDTQDNLIGEAAGGNTSLPGASFVLSRTRIKFSFRRFLLDIFLKTECEE